MAAPAGPTTASAASCGRDDGHAAGRRVARAPSSSPGRRLDLRSARSRGCSPLSPVRRIWGLVALWTDRELAVAAAGVGVLVGGAIRVVAGRGGHDLQFVAVVESLPASCSASTCRSSSPHVTSSGRSLGLLSTDTVSTLPRQLPHLFCTYDFLWIALALGLRVGESSSRQTPRRGRGVEYHTRNPVDRLTRRLPRDLRIAVDWIVTIAGAVAIVLLVKAYVVNPYRIPSSSHGADAPLRTTRATTARRASPIGCLQTGSSTTFVTRSAARSPSSRLHRRRAASGGRS